MKDFYSYFDTAKTAITHFIWGAPPPPPMPDPTFLESIANIVSENPRSIEILGLVLAACSAKGVHYFYGSKTNPLLNLQQDLSAKIQDLLKTNPAALKAITQLHRMSDRETIELLNQEPIAREILKMGKAQSEAFAKLTGALRLQYMQTIKATVLSALKVSVKDKIGANKVAILKDNLSALSFVDNLDNDDIKVIDGLSVAAFTEFAKADFDDLNKISEEKKKAYITKLPTTTAQVVARATSSLKG